MRPERHEAKIKAIIHALRMFSAQNRVEEREEEEERKKKEGEKGRKREASFDLSKGAGNGVEKAADKSYSQKLRRMTNPLKRIHMHI